MNILKYGNVIAIQSIGINLLEIEQKRHNIWIGASINNKAFSKENIRVLINFCLQYTKEKILVEIPGRMHATNYKYFDGLTRAEALKKAFKDEDARKKELSEIIDGFPAEVRKNIVVANYDDICTPDHIRIRELFFREFAEQSDFYQEVIDIIREIFLTRGRTPSKERLESLALYVIHELPLFVNGVQTNNDPSIYTATPYPGLGKIDQLVMNIIDGKKYPELSKKINIKNRTGIININFKQDGKNQEN
ncbi:hypothetical protein A2567_03140 [Candidatus Azambacteria bacterium RIFOXYD1_FULL_42_11]|uniref:Cyclodipeptide synthase n=4 Tax=Candidatus Azamiibacteriota TaxID=1752741 RepID=A0A0G1C960_9BACT|nr:MAG: hypothetical protein UV07_C0010G0009 [Candidatus Azambacteria bacterium GW2011_GWB1_42_17]KKS46153.1 MAG: hypothetical protein UV10_C0007G0009 [Candidatus Azambacteria bacterium GW2011_GWA1_42_19]KKS75730.1 MAG: hypothetical protein UV48_C0007G0005 [Candidatus Azambacteria bacterium GW2011_GWA2_42_9]KKS88497.1 MAG: hypothetical protein UV62_C0006G0008 [Parcubacteria group bacterium GW2011_GWC1_43_11]OGD42023.1 MAG: hypothetical protein A2567_03140 [Candidatus Azambacteria bacterium RIFO